MEKSVIIDGINLNIIFYDFTCITGVRQTFGQSFNFYEMNFNDGVLMGRGIYTRLYIQEGAIVEINCKSEIADRESEYDNEYWYGIWLLDYENSQSTAIHVDSDVFEITDNWERYHSQDVTDSGSLVNYVKFASKLRYIGRQEDHGKYLQCKTTRGSIASTRHIRGGTGPAIVLIVRRKDHYKFIIGYSLVACALVMLVPV